MSRPNLPPSPCSTWLPNWAAVCLGVWLALSGARGSGAEPAEAPAPQYRAERGCWQFTVSSPYQPEPTPVEVLRPEKLVAERRYPVLYILPVVGFGNDKYGDGLLEARKADLANRLGVICVAPSFSGIPWLGDHATKVEAHQEEHFLKAVVPAIERLYPVQAEREGRWLLGFSKSGWAAFTLRLRHSETFGYAAAWDAPLMLDGGQTGREWGPMGIESVFGTREAFLAYLPTLLVPRQAAALRERTRLVLGPGASWQKQTEAMHQLLQQLSIPHVYREDLLLPHRWDSGWLVPLAMTLAETARQAPGGTQPPP